MENSEESGDCGVVADVEPLAAVFCEAGTRLGTESCSLYITPNKQSRHHFSVTVKVTFQVHLHAIYLLCSIWLF
jgi:hypothetical protein